MIKVALQCSGSWQHVTIDPLLEQVSKNDNMVSLWSSMPGRWFIASVSKYGAQYNCCLNGNGSAEACVPLSVSGEQPWPEMGLKDWFEFYGNDSGDSCKL